MAGNVSAFCRSVDLRHLPAASSTRRPKTQHYVAVGRWATVLGVVGLQSVAAYLVMNAKGIMDYVQALFSFFIAPLLGSILMGMFWKRATRQGGFWGISSSARSLLSFAFGHGSISTLRLSVMKRSHRTPKTWRRTCTALCGPSCATVIVTFIVSMVTTARPVAELKMDWYTA